MMKTLLFSLVQCFFIFGMLHSQVAYQEDAVFREVRSARSLLPVSMADVNGDGYDDIIRIADGNRLEIIYTIFSAEDGLRYQMHELRDVPASDVWSLAVGEINGKTGHEILLGRAFGDHQYVVFENGEWRATPIENDKYTQASNLVDIDLDGTLEWFVSMDDTTNQIFKFENNRFVNTAKSLIDLETIQPSDNSGNYGSEWTDIDQDGDLDLYISKCKIDALSSDDPRRVNLLYENDNGTYVESQEAMGLRIGAQSWASSFADLDNDGDYDGVVVNHGAPISLLENMGNERFEFRNEVLGPLYHNSLQTTVRDFDNNGFQDILLVGDQDVMYWNQGEFQFVEQKNPFAHNRLSSFAIGDLNRDGLLDIFGVNGGNGFNVPGNANDVVLLAQQSETIADRHYISMVPPSTALAIGAKVEVHVGDDRFVREIKAGESYGIMNSYTVHVGLGSHDVIDSIVVPLIDGTSFVYHDVMVDRYYQMSEDFRSLKPISIGGSILQQCDLETTQATIDPAHEQTFLSWDNGSTSKMVDMSDEELRYYFYSENGSVFQSSPYYFQNIKSADEDVILAHEEYYSCLDAPLTVNYRLTSAAEGMSAEVMPNNDGPTQFTVDGVCATYQKEVNITDLTGPAPQLKIDTLYDEDVKVVLSSVDGDALYWSVDDQQAAISDSLVLTNIEDDVAVEARLPIEGVYNEQFVGGETNFVGTNFYSGNLNGGLLFDVHMDMLLESVAVFTDMEGERTILILNADGDTLVRHQQLITNGYNFVPIDTELPAGQNYLITTDVEENQLTFGTQSPRLVRNNAMVQYPYEVGEMMTLNSSNFGRSFYYYFYQWKTKRANEHCVSDPTQVLIEKDKISSTIDQDASGTYWIYPNPTDYSITILSEDSGQVKYKLLSNLGQVVLSGAFLDETAVNVEDLAPGMYFLYLENDKRISVVRKIVKQ